MHRALFGKPSPALLHSFANTFGAIVLLSLVGALSYSQTAPPAARQSAPGASAVKRLDLSSVSQVEAYVRELHKQSPAGANAAHPPAGGIGGGMHNVALPFWDAYLYYIKQRAFPNDRVDWHAYDRAARQRDALPAAKPPRVPTAGAGKPAAGGVRLQGMSQPQASAWEFVGPVGMTHPSGVWAFGPSYISGRVNALAYAPVMPDPVDTSGILWLGAAGGGLWKSVDGGTTWVPLGDQWPTLNVSAIAVDPTDYNTVYVGTGDFHGFGGYGKGIMKTTDGGQTWTNLNSPLFGSFWVSRIVVDQRDPQTVIATVGDRNQSGSILVSNDGGQTWAVPADESAPGFPVPSASWSGVTQGPDGTLFAVSEFPVYLYMSRNHGSSWFPVAAPSNTPGWVPGIDVAASKRFAGVFYLLVPNLFKPSDSKIQATFDYANTWNDNTSGFKDDWSQGWYDYHVTTTIGIDPNSGYPTDYVYVGLLDLNQGILNLNNNPPSLGWTILGNVYSSNSLMHTDQHAMAIDPRDPDQALLGNDGGVYHFSYDEQGLSWMIASLNRTLGITQFYRHSPHPFDPAQIIGGAQDNASPHSTADPLNWVSVFSGDGAFCEINPLSPLIQFTSAQYLSIVRTQNNWQSTQYIAPYTGTDNVAFIAPFALDPLNPRYLYAGTNYLYRWDDYKFMWTPRLGGQKLSPKDAISYIAVAPSDSNRIYTCSFDGVVFMTRDGGVTWRNITGNLPKRSVTGIAVAPANPNRVIVTLSGTGTSHVWRCDDTTALPVVWTDISGTGGAVLPDIPANTVALDLNDPVNSYYVGTDIGVFSTADGGQTWANMTAPLGLPNVQVNDLKTVPGTGYLSAATFGRGIWRIKIGNPAYPLGSLVLIPPTIKGGKTGTGIVSLIVPAPLGGQTVSLSSSNPSIVTVPSTITVTAGYQVAKFTVLTTKVTKAQTVIITAASGARVRNAALKVVP